MTDHDREQAVLDAMRAKIAESAAELRRLQGASGAAAAPDVAPAARVAKWRPAGDGDLQDPWRAGPATPAAPDRTAPAPDRTAPVPGAADVPAASRDVALARQLADLSAEQHRGFAATRAEIAAQAAQLEVQRGELLDQTRALAEHRREAAQLDEDVREVLAGVTALGRRLDAREVELARRLARVLVWVRVASGAAVVAVVAAVASLIVSIS